MTLAFEDANSKLLDVFRVADADAKDRVDDEIWSSGVSLKGSGRAKIKRKVFLGLPILQAKSVSDLWRGQSG